MMAIPTLQSQMTSSLVRLARIYRMAVDGALSGLGLSDALALPVVVLGRHPEGARQNTIAEELGVEGPSLVRLLDRLVEAGMVERREDPTDRRAKTVHLTPNGARHGERAAKALDAFRATLLSEVSDSDLQACLRVFAAVERKLSSARRDPKS